MRADRRPRYHLCRSQTVSHHKEYHAMPRTALTPQAMWNLFSGNPAATNLDVVEAAADVGNGNKYSPSGNDVLYARNSHATAPYTITIGSVKDPHGRTMDLTS